MESIYLGGMVTAWCLAQVALGVFFLLGHFLGRREPDLAIFAALCAALALHSLESARAQLASRLAERAAGVDGVVAAAFRAAAVNVQFVLSFTSAKHPRWLVSGLYLGAIVFELVNALGGFWQPGSARLFSTSAFGAKLEVFRATPTPVGVIGFALIALELCAAQALLFGAFRRGRREALIAFIGGLCLLGAATNDMLMSAGKARDALVMVPHGFMVYAYAVASTLVVRYGRAAGRLVRTSEDLRRATTELEVSHAELREIQDELLSKQELAAVGELAAAIAHEVRNPLAIISNALSGLRSERASEGDRSVLLGIVQEETDRLSRLVTDLTRFARPSSLKRQPVDMVELTELARAGLPDSHELVLAASPGEQPRIEGDPNLHSAVHDNLLQNACQAMPFGGKIQVCIDPEDRDGLAGLRIQVEDHGTGMDQATLARALDPFYTTRPSGTGLGLSIVQRIVRAHGGRVELESAPEQGTRVKIWLPPAAVSAPEPEPDSAISRPDARVRLSSV